ncbi:MAG: hypothetical protein OK455_08920 [Thaumarchaeota archaeon]|nr:hypothetical protein [Nitrososphaerota archaeon]
MTLDITGLKQVPPIVAGTATLNLTFKISGDLPSFVQVYALVPGAAKATPVKIVPMIYNQNEYSVPVQVAAGAYLVIYACSRDGPMNLPDDTTGGEYWESACAAAYIATKTVAPLTQKLDPPVIDAFVPYPANLNQPNRITVMWSSATSYDKYVLGWYQDGVPSDPQKLDFTKLTVNMDDPLVTTKGSIDLNDIKGTSGSYQMPTEPSCLYFFRVNGGISQTWNYNYSAWGPTEPYVAIPNSRSLRHFLTDSGLDPAAQGVRSRLSPGQKVRNFMQI